ncbi:hypothetical protein LXG23DRAFT_20586 [Yarrowia lipolytica]|uniref:Uncharacterized protein n=1 Tax=Yarrowia lipolytica TaxID=4952 RepID=A0A1D8NFK5_YARLL|nr:hypothetical protein YALI1_D26559g [Yarrowia lipolytica]KAB8285784.1 hypothetical protein BKA91DRAFT_78166 [Yarrowia lipolytica]KAE8171873.1 hypothetical protein BKA90DRAFT_153152 [Yarrowia lipolytica]KAJ8054124.1 hypothetical protein LXG23DRAFT_20586 [Yarrowia lipolytica]RMI99418.1 hypothetical protein BD777DRAFT_140342 [Yarrowia lipolytica]
MSCPEIPIWIHSESLFRIAIPGFKLPPSSLRAVGVYASGAIFSLGFYAMLDAALYSSHKNVSTVHVRFFPDWLPLLFSCIGMLVINLVEKARLQSALTGGSSFSSGEDWQAKVVLFLGFAFLAGGMASSIAVLVLKYALPGYSMPTLGMGVANVICNASVMVSCVLLWVAQNIEDEYSYSLSL